MDKEYQAKDLSVSQRQIYILSLLSENAKGYQAEEIRERLRNWDIEVSKRTIMRDIDELSLHYGIGEEERNGKTYYFADKYTLKNVDLTMEDLMSLAFAKEMLRPYAHLDMGKHAISFLDKIVTQSAALNQFQFDRLCGAFKQGSANKGNADQVDAVVEKQVQQAIDNGNKLSMEYYSFTSDEYTKRKIHPYQLLLIDEYLCVEAYCELRKDVRRFRLSRMKNVKVLDEHFSDVVEREKLDNPFLKLAGGQVEDLELVFTGESIRYVKEYEASRAKKLEAWEDGLHFYQTAAVAPDVVRWIRGFGADVKVMKPEWLKNQLMEEAKKRLED